MQGSDNADSCQHEDMLRLLEDSLLVCKDMLGPEHPNTLAGMNNLAIGYQEAGQFGRAIELFEEALRLTNASLGPEHPSTLATMNSLAACYQAAGRLDKALPLLEETMRLREAAANA